MRWQIVWRLFSRLEEVAIRDWESKLQSRRYRMYSLACAPATPIAVIAVLTLWLPASDAVLAGAACFVTSLCVEFLVGFLAGVHDGVHDASRRRR